MHETIKYICGRNTSTSTALNNWLVGCIMSAIVVPSDRY